MICDNCKIEKLITDFINSKNICYKCLYRIKLGKMSEKRTEKACLCRTCGNQIINKENEKKRQRTVFCSFECAERGHKKQLNNHWTRKVGQPGEISNGKSINYRSKQKDSWSDI
jgi:hypothetical protein